ncbi:eyes absent homolog [Vicia villosa]|uniref:eyes absent homolog n=1 Tax=Vicia villosa TaxID=3911 RepID=UPI00273AC987|nr:eyes absent homolog [Vicia villosa]
MADTSGMAEEETQVSSSDEIDPRMDVYVWDMDETLILLNSLMKSSYVEAFNGLKDVPKCVELGRIDGVFVLQIENYIKLFLDVMSKYDDGRDLFDYDFNKDELGPPHDDVNKRKLAYRPKILADGNEDGVNEIQEIQSNIK